jgi:hypothetical protein
MGKMCRLEYVVNGQKRLTGKVAQRTRLLITKYGRGNRIPGIQQCYGQQCFFGFLWVGEVVAPSNASYNATTHLSYGDVRVNRREAPQYLKVRLKRSKTDLFQKGAMVRCTWGARSGAELCPVGAVLDYMVGRGGALLHVQGWKSPHQGKVCHSVTASRI